jgi:cellulose biosynthesis protein BcsQ
MKIISIFNNKGGVGKTTLTFHLASILAEMGKKVLILDLDPQCNISLYGMNEDQLEDIWRDEDAIIDNGFGSINIEDDGFKNLFNSPRTTHFLLKSVEEGISDFETLPPPFEVIPNLDLIPGRLTLFMYEAKIAERWSGMFLGEPLSIRTVTRIRKLAELYAKEHSYDFVIVDTSPNLGALNKVIVSMVDGFIIPCLPDMFSLYGIKNIGKALIQWQRELSVCFSIISEEKRKGFPMKFVRFLGYVIYNAKKSPNTKLENLSKANHHYAKEIPDEIRENVDKKVREHLTPEMVENSIGNNSIIHTHNTFPIMAQKYKKPMWHIPDCNVDEEDKETIRRVCDKYKATKEMYQLFADDFLKRVETLDD